VFLQPGAMLDDTTTDPSHSEKHVYFVQQLMEWCFSEDQDTLRLLTLDVEKSHPPFSAGLVYQILRPAILAYKIPPTASHNATLDGKLKSELFMHQRAAVSWMLERENTPPFVFAPNELEAYWRTFTINRQSFGFNLVRVVTTRNSLGA